MIPARIRRSRGHVRSWTCAGRGPVDDYAEGWFNLGMVLFGQEQYGEAEDCFGRSLGIDASDAQTWNNRGVCLWKLGRSPEAKACFQKAIEIDPSDADAAFNLQSIG